MRLHILEELNRRMPNIVEACKGKVSLETHLCVFLFRTDGPEMAYASDVDAVWMIKAMRQCADRLEEREKWDRRTNGG